MNLKIGLHSFDPFPGAIEYNGKRIVKIIEKAKTLGVELLVFPEMSLPGYCIGDLHSNPVFIQRQNDTVKNILLPATKGISVILGLTVEDKNFKMGDGSTGRFNGYLLITNGKIIKTGKKSLLVNEGVLEDSRYFLLGNPKEIQPAEIEIPGKGTIKAGIMICQDIWDDHADVHPSKLLKDKGAELLLVLNSSPFHLKKLDLRIKTTFSRVKETNLPLFYVNTTGIQDIGKNLVIFDGSSFAITNHEIKLSTSPFKEELLICDVDSTKKVSNLPPKPAVDSTMDLLEKSLIFTISQFFKRTNVFKGVVIGLSGGIDSAVDALLISKAIGADKLLCVNMPSKYNSKTTKDIAANIANSMGCEYIIHSIENSIDGKTSSLEQSLGRELKAITKENMQARERGNILMEYSQEYGYMVVGNGNKTEFQRGYATLYGDILGAIMPLGDVTKLQVFQLAKHLDPDNKIIPQQLLTLKPSAELSSNHDVDAGKGDPFDYYLESPMGVELVENGISPEDLKVLFETKALNREIWIDDPKGLSPYDKMNGDEFFTYAKEVATAIRRSYFKRVQAPPIPVVSPRAFGMDYRESLFPPPQ
jgi:NAD+ synthase (glutamine-hydrolysing)